MYVMLRNIHVFPLRPALGMAGLQRYRPSKNYPFCSFANQEVATNSKQKKKTSGKENSRNTIHPSLKKIVAQYPFLAKRKHTFNQENEVSYIVHPEVIDLIVKSVNKTISNETVVLECNPGPGLLTKALLEAGVQKLKVYEDNDKFLENLEVLASEFPEILTLVKQDLHYLPSLSAREVLFSEDGVHDLFEGIKYQLWNNPSPPLILIAVLLGTQGSKFIRFLINRLAIMDCIYAYGRAQLLIIIPSNEYAYLTAYPKLSYQAYRPITVLYKLFFHCEVIDQLPKEYFLPPVKSQSRITTRDKHLYLVRLTPRADLFEAVAPKEKLQELIFFVQQNLFSRNAYVIPNLEKWIPNCGPHFIKKGFAVFQKFGDLSPEEILEVFHIFSSLPDYHYAAFKVAFKRDTVQHGYELLDDDLDLFFNITNKDTS